ncbi:dihydrodipicolinate synthase family protein [Gluconacetobacter entanii]|uniref:Dihydrodipicolinate synthase family protein n=1 Tax=Gluconacetobacter entanii TaxID=108528 RepID=A0ABT3K9U4_9PROT|nr:dihydrodipicolinate synthase family protein [Gluconacetobacter entanii]MCE2577764.1 dihydrodipicolinate synthase family protein [Komagataeibacter sp. FNDCR1]MBY4639024.1 dihydrodipicolinate synthase family protein [Gluconacetobacter entanii]MCW4580818.1 dihydrodipicolinate synthase family protein [Gluconacetobacter entanii]MCW4584147.1 dihydrodipicolinate synthase family protein [Gluconacetobacter entanii]MCW4587492.1 dihydrodipicolinate synthase family protein [Gluconacetobacter entanii]
MQWTGVFPAATTQFAPDLSIDFAATQKVLDNLIGDGVHGLTIMGTCGENNSLEPDEKLKVLAAACETAKGRVPVIVGVSELTTPRAVKFAADAARIGADALMVLPAMVYVPKEAELVAHLKAVAAASDLPIMLYNNPTAYRVNISMDVLRELTDVETIVAVKESSANTRRYTDVVNAFGDRYIMMAGLDDVAFEGLTLGAAGWISGLTSAFPQESVELVEALQKGNMARALEIYRWFMPLLHLDAEHDLVQSIKLAEQIMGRGNERVRMPRMPLTGARRAEVTAMVEKAAATRPSAR